MKNYNRNDFKLTFDKQNTQFFVNEKKGTVSCIITAYLVTPSSYDWDSPVSISSKVFKYTGVAKCHADDTFDVERGKRIAMAKAENKIYLKAVAYLEKEQEHIIFMNKAITEFTEKAYHQCTHNVEYIESVSNPEHPKYKKTVTKVKSGITNGLSNN